MTDKQELQSRWDAPVAGADLAESPYGMTKDGLKDFRGAALTSMHKFRADKSDFSYTYLKTLKANIGQISVGVIENSLFNYVKYEGTLAPDEVCFCIFNKGVIDAVFMCGRWSDCIFNDVNFKKSRAGKRVVFDKCVFTSCNMTHIQFMGCAFIECVFENCKVSEWTSFAESEFINCDLSKMNFNNAIMDDVLMK